MNPKAKKYYQEINKENLVNKQYRIKQNSDKDASRPVLASQAHFQAHSRVHTTNSPIQKHNNMRKMESKKNIIGRNMCSYDKSSGVRFPKISKEEVAVPIQSRKKHCKSFKKMMTEPADY